tara:strand:+ start:1334 stop:1633 length:300 start_codon:yes stop_codon:yes gene_type:complete
MPPYIKTAWEPNLQSVTKDRYKFHESKKIFAYIKTTTRFSEMKKNFDEVYSAIEVDPATDRYYMAIPEEVMNELDWYEDIVLKWNLDIDGIYLTLKKDD